MSVIAYIFRIYLYYRIMLFEFCLSLAYCPISINLSLNQLDP